VVPQGLRVGCPVPFLYSQIPPGYVAILVLRIVVIIRNPVVRIRRCGSLLRRVNTDHEDTGSAVGNSCWTRSKRHRIGGVMSDSVSNNI
jgi:hypothetical protein